MGFNSCYLPNIELLISYYEEYGLEVFVKRFMKYDSWSGDSQSINYLETKIKEYEQNKRISDERKNG